MCVCVRERERDRERDNAFDNVVAYVVVDSNVDAIVVIDHVAIVAATFVDVDLVDDHVIVVASGTAPPKAHKRCSRSRSPCHFGRRSTWRHCLFSNSSGNFLLDPAEVKPVPAIRQSRVTIDQSHQYHQQQQQQELQRQ